MSGEREVPDGQGWGDPEEPPAVYGVPGAALPADARRMGLTHHVPDGALLDFAHHLDSSKLRHRVTAWVMLAVFGLPVVLYALRLLQALAQS